MWRKLIAGLMVASVMIVVGCGGEAAKSGGETKAKAADAATEDAGAEDAKAEEAPAEEKKEG